MPNTDFNGGSDDTAACEEVKLVKDQYKDKFTDSDGKFKVGKPDELLWVALVAESTKTREETCKDVKVEKFKDAKSVGSKPG